MNARDRIRTCVGTKPIGVLISQPFGLITPEMPKPIPFDHSGTLA